MNNFELIAEFKKDLKTFFFCDQYTNNSKHTMPVEKWSQELEKRAKFFFQKYNSLILKNGKLEVNEFIKFHGLLFGYLKKYTYYYEYSGGKIDKLTFWQLLHSAITNADSNEVKNIF